VTVVARDEMADTVTLENGEGRRVQLGTRAAGKILVAPATAESAAR
jgi:hypothetical protein